jgi:hypothetical protein
MHIMAENAKIAYFVQFPVLQDEGDVLNGQDTEIGRDTEGDLRQHGMDIGMPEDEPTPYGLTNIDGEHGYGARVADESYDYRCIDDIS